MDSIIPLVRKEEVEAELLEVWDLVLKDAMEAVYSDKVQHNHQQVHARLTGVEVIQVGDLDKDGVILQIMVVVEVVDGMVVELVNIHPQGGGSGYVLTSNSYKPSGYMLGSQYYLTNTSMSSGVRSGNGYATITLIE